MKTLTWLLTCGLALVLVGTTTSAQYGAGWTIPPEAKNEKSPLKPTGEVLKKGKGLFTARCQKCHGAEGTGDGPGADPKNPPADLTDEFRADLNPEGVVFYRIWNGKPPIMPAFKSQLSKDEAWQIVAYVQTLRKPAPK